MAPFYLCMSVCISEPWATYSKQQIGHQFCVVCGGNLFVGDGVYPPRGGGVTWQQFPPGWGGTVIPGGGRYHNRFEAHRSGAGFPLYRKGRLNRYQRPAWPQHTCLPPQGCVQPCGVLQKVATNPSRYYDRELRAILQWPMGFCHTG